MQDPHFFGLEPEETEVIQELVSQAFANGTSGNAPILRHSFGWLKASPGNGGDKPRVHLVVCKDDDLLIDPDTGAGTPQFPKFEGALYRGLDHPGGSWPRCVLFYTTHWDNASWRELESRWVYMARVEGVRWKIVFVTPDGHFVKLMKSSELPAEFATP